MGWRGNYDTTVSKVTHSDWTFSLRAMRELLIGYRIWSSREGEVLGGDRWVWFTGALQPYGEVQILAQWPDSRKGTPRSGDRCWHWVHWRNRGSDAVIQPWALIAPPPVGWFHYAKPELQKRDLWILVERATPVAAGVSLAIAGGSSGGRAVKEGWKTAVTVRPLQGQTLRKARLQGELQSLPTEKLWRRIDRLVKGTRVKEAR